MPEGECEVEEWITDMRVTLGKIEARLDEQGRINAAILKRLEAHESSRETELGRIELLEKEHTIFKTTVYTAYSAVCIFVSIWAFYIKNMVSGD